MKQVLIFVIIITICGSLAKAPIIVPVRCGNRVKGSYYLKGKLVHTDIQSNYHQISGYSSRTVCHLHSKEIEFKSDSTVFEVYYKKSTAYNK